MRRIWTVLILCWALSLRLDVVVAVAPGLQGNPPDLIITEIMQNPAIISDAEGEWFELYNAGGDPYDLDGCLLRDLGTDNHTIDNAGSLIINPGAYLILGRDGDTGVNGNVPLDYEYSGFTLGNADDEVILECDGAEVDRVEYDGGPNFLDPMGPSMQLLSPALDNNNGSNWCAATGPWPGSAGDFGTPGADTICLRIGKTASPVIDVPYGGEVTYEITITNPTAFATNPVSLTDSLPAGVDFNRWLNRPAGATVTNDQLAWTGNISDQETVVFDFVVDHVGNYGDVVTNQVEYNYAGSNDAAQATFNVVSQPFLGQVVINEVMPAPDAVNDSDGEWIELFNPGSIPVDLNGCTLNDDGGSSHVINNGEPLIIVPGGYLVLGANDDPLFNGGVGVDYAYSSYLLADGEDEVVLVCSETEADRVTYDNSFPFTDGASMQLLDPGLNNDNSANWCQASTSWPDSAGDFGTPGEANACPADLGLTKLVDPANANPGQAFEYTLTFTNYGPALAGGVVLTDIVPIYMSDVTVSSGGATISPAGGQSFVWDVEDLSPDEGGTITLQGELVSPLPAGFVFTNTAYIATIMPDLAQGNNQGQAIVTVNNARPQAVNDNPATTEETAVTISVLANDSDPNGDNLTLVSIGSPANGTATINGPTVVYTPALNFAGQESFTYEISDGLLTDAATITATVNPVNDPPTAQDDAVQTAEAISVTISVLDNDTDIDGNLDPASVEVMANPANGLTTVETATGDITYSPNPDFSGDDSFIYGVCDDGTPLPSLCATAAVTVTVQPENEPPLFMFEIYVPLLSKLSP